MSIGECKEGLLAKACVDGPLPLVDEVKFLEDGRRVAGLALGTGSKDGDPGRIGNFRKPPRRTCAVAPLPPVLPEQLIVTVAKIF